MTERIEDWLSEAERGYAARPLTALQSLIEGGGRGPAERDLALRVEEAPLRGIVLIQAGLEEPELLAALSEPLASMGFTLEPAPEPGRAQWIGEQALLRLDAETALLLTPYGEAAAAADRLDAALRGRSRLVEPVSDAWAGFRVTGRGVREALAKGVPLDLHPAAFAPGEARRASIGAVETVLLALEGAPESFEVLCRRSQGAAFYRWLLTAAAAGALPEAIPSAEEAFDV